MLLIMMRFGRWMSGRLPNALVSRCSALICKFVLKRLFRRMRHDFMRSCRLVFVMQATGHLMVVRWACL